MELNIETHGLFPPWLLHCMKLQQYFFAGVNMVLSTSLLNFGLVKLPEDKARRSFYIFNQSDVDVAYQVCDVITWEHAFVLFFNYPQKSLE